MKPSIVQRRIIDEWINTSNYVYNNTIECINQGDSINHFKLRDKLVTENTKKNNPEYKNYSNQLELLCKGKKPLYESLKSHNKNSTSYNEINAQIEKLKCDIEEKKKTRKEITAALKSEKNNYVHEWECNTPKCVRDGAVSDVCKAYKTGFSNLKAGNIKHFRMKYKKKTNPIKSVVIPKNLVKNKHGNIHLASQFFKENAIFKMGKRTIKKYKNLVIENDTRIVKQKNEYFIIIPIKINDTPKTSPVNYCGIDPGVRTFMTTFGNNDCVEYHHNELVLKNLNQKIKNLKELRTLKVRKRIAKKSINKIEKRKSNLIDELHWKVIADLLERHDVIFYGDIKSHDIVKNKHNHTLNRNINDLKFYKFKERLLFKAIEKNKKIVLVNEAYTSQTCSCCGAMYKPGCSKVYECKKCNKHMDRDVNASKNILMKGIMKL